MLTLTELCYASRGLGPLSLSLEGGQVVLLCGPSGSGKSTLCELIAGDLEPTGGEVVRPPRVGTMTADVESQLLGSSVAQELELGRLAGTLGRAPAGGPLASLARRWVGRENVDPQTLSSGEQHLLLLASLALGGFPLLVLDEGLSCLDQESFREVCAGLRALAREGVLVILVSHELRALPWVDRCVGLRNGRLVLDKAAASVTGADLSQLRIWTGTLSLAPDRPVLGGVTEPSPTAPRLALETGQRERPEGGVLEHESGLKVDMADGVLAIAGPTGSGKSRLLSSMRGLESVAGWRFVEARQQYVVMLPQPASSVLWHRSVAAELRASLAEGRRRGATPGDDVAEIPSDWQPRSPRSLSHGQAKLLGCLCLLLQKPDLLLLDEPFSGLDADLRQQLERRLRSYLAGGGRLVISTHQSDEMVLYASALLVLHQGKPEYLGPPWQYFQSEPESPLGQPYVFGVRPAAPARDDGQP